VELSVPNLTADAVCCGSCGQRAPYLPNGLTDWHLDRAGQLCAAIFPRYVTARPR
jgi:hypothetical protein